LDRFVAYAQKQFQLPLLAGCFASERCEPKIPASGVLKRSQTWPCERVPGS